MLQHLLGFTMAVCLFTACAQSETSVTIIDAEELLTMQKDGVVVVDVRTPEEVKQGKIPGAVNVPLSPNFAQSMKDYAKDQQVILYCRSGRRSTMASEQLEQAGFQAVFNYKGSFNDWTDQKKPVE